MFKPVFEKAVDWAKGELCGTGTIGPTAVFVYGKDGWHEELKEGAARVVSLRWRNEFQKEAVKRRLQEKVAAEGASAVVLLLPTEAASPHQGQCWLLGATPYLCAEVSITYTTAVRLKLADHHVIC
jgi:hypothetical protein